MQIQQNGNKLSGKFNGQRGSVPLTGNLEGNQVSLRVKRDGAKLRSPEP
jgi:hypothetical protein